MEHESYAYIVYHGFNNVMCSKQAKDMLWDFIKKNKKSLQDEDRDWMKEIHDACCI
jgi:hypothetical protein